MAGESVFVHIAAQGVSDERHLFPDEKTLAPRRGCDPNMYVYPVVFSYGERNRRGSLSLKSVGPIQECGRLDLMARCDLQTQLHEVYNPHFTPLGRNPTAYIMLLMDDSDISTLSSALTLLVGLLWTFGIFGRERAVDKYRNLITWSAPSHRNNRCER